MQIDFLNTFNVSESGLSVLCVISGFGLLMLFLHVVDIKQHWFLSKLSLSEQVGGMVLLIWY